MQPRILLPLAALGLVFAAPAAANAAVTPAIDGTRTLTLTGDDTSENFTLGVDAAGNLTHSFGQVNGLANNTDFNTDPAATTHAAVQRHDHGRAWTPVAATTTINLSAANILAPVINGGAGDDVIVGSDVVDTISGGDGNDRITGGRGDETINGGLGNDVMVWNNGEGDDINIGGGGVDETSIVTGTGDDNMTVSPNGARIRIERGFKVDMEDIDRLSITSFSGNDTLTTQPGITLPMTIDAGSGNDTITTGDGADLINGGDGNDTLNGAGGGDRIVGDRGGDTMNGGAGDDTTVWNNGDGSDMMNGDDGVDRVETNLSRRPPTTRRSRSRTAASATTASTRAVQPQHRDRRGLRAQRARRRRHPDDDRPTSRSRSWSTPARATTPSRAARPATRSTAATATTPSSCARTSPTSSAAAWAPTRRPSTRSTRSRPTSRPSIARRRSPLRGSERRRAAAKLGVNVSRASPSSRSPARPASASARAPSRCARRRAASKTLGKANYTLKAGESKTLKIKLAKDTAKLAKNKKLTVKARVTSGAGAAKTAKLTLRFRVERRIALWATDGCFDVKQPWQPQPRPRPPRTGRSCEWPCRGGLVSGGGSRADPVPDRAARLFVRRRGRAAAGGHDQLLDHPADLRRGVGQAGAVLADAGGRLPGRDRRRRRRASRRRSR